MESDAFVDKIASLIGRDDLKKKIKSSTGKASAFLTNRSGQSEESPRGDDVQKTKSDAEALKVEDGTKSEGKGAEKESDGDGEEKKEGEQEEEAKRSSAPKISNKTQSDYHQKNLSALSNQ